MYPASLKRTDVMNAPLISSVAVRKRSLNHVYRVILHDIRKFSTVENFLLKRYNEI